jgi:hypothetical protein
MVESGHQRRQRGTQADGEAGDDRIHFGVTMQRQDGYEFDEQQAAMIAEIMPAT